MLSLKVTTFFAVTLRITVVTYAILSILFLPGCSKDSFVSKDDLKHPDSSFLPVIFLCGQSNMEGVPADSFVASYFKQPIPNAYIYYKQTNTANNNGIVETLTYRQNNNWRSPAEHFGPEEGIAWYLTQQNHRVAIVKYAYGGSKLSLAGDPCPFGYWQSDGVDSLNHFQILINNWAIQSMQAFKKAGFKPYTAAFIWCQGEKDAHDKIAADVYQKNLVKLLDNFKADMIAEDSLVVNMRVIITRTRNSYRYANAIRKAQESVANNYYNGYWIDSDSWSVLPDKVHYTANAQATMQGKAIADILMKVIP